MIRTMYAICASRIIRDASDNRISVVDILDDFTAQGFPIVFPRTSMLWVLSRDEGDAEELEGSIAMFMNEALLQQFSVHINFEHQPKTRAILIVGGVTIQVPGVLKFSFTRAGEQKPDTHFEVKITAAPAVLAEIVGGTNSAGGLIAI